MSGARFQIGWYNGWSPEERLAVIPRQRAAVRSGAIPQPVRCSICGTTPEAGSANSVWLHDENYAEPLSSYPICRSCHRTLHNRFEDPDPWVALIKEHGDGRRWFEQLTMDPASLQQPFVITYPQGLPRP
jgi:hypothetical protein